MSSCWLDLTQTMGCERVQQIEGHGPGAVQVAGGSSVSTIAGRPTMAFAIATASRWVRWPWLPLSGASGPSGE